MEISFLMGTQKTGAFSKGFTIVELLVVIAVIGILAAISFVSYNVVRDNAKSQSISSDLSTTATNLTKYKSQNGGYPSSAAEFNASIEKSNTSGQTSYTYNYYSTEKSYCLVAAGTKSSFYVTSADSTVKEGSSCPVTLTVTSPTNINTAPNVNITITGTAAPGNKIIASQCGSLSIGYQPGTRCYAASTVSTTVPASGNWTLQVYMVDFIGTGQTILGTNPQSTNANCTGVGQCEMQIFDFGSISNPTNVNQAINSKTIPVHAQIN